MADVAGANGERKDFKIVSKPNVPGRLSYAIATGKAKFGTVPRMLYAKFLRSPYGRASIKSADIRKAKALQGVVDILLSRHDPATPAMAVQASATPWRPCS